jgi:aminoglycoside phosphotransferase (APT) family kinase protein
MPFLDLSQDDAAMRRIMVDLGLAKPDEPVVATPLAGGVSSGIYRIDLASGSYCLKQALPQLKVAKEWKVPVQRVFHEIDWLRTAAAIVPGHVPKVLGQDDATMSFVMEYLGGERRPWKADLLAGVVDAGIAAQVGDVLGRIHAATADDPQVARRFATDANFHAIRLEPYLVEASRMHPDAADRLLAAVDRTASTRRVLVHGDVSPKNVVVGGGRPVLLDAECAWFGDPAFDVAFCLNHFLLKAAHRPAGSAALLACFEGFVAAYLPHVTWEAVDAVQGRAAALLPGLALARVDGKSPVEYLSEPRRHVVREASLRLLRSPSPTLDKLAQRWAEDCTA